MELSDEPKLGEVKVSGSERSSGLSSCGLEPIIDPSVVVDLCCLRIYEHSRSKGVKL